VILIYTASKFLIKEKGKVGAFVHGTFRGNFIYVGFSLLENVTGTVGAKASLIVAFVVPLYNVLAVLILILTNPNNRSNNQLKNAVKSIITNPFIIANYFDVLATPLALLTIGATFEIDKLFVDIVPSIYATIFKLVLIPAAAVSGALYFGFNNSEVFLIYILFGVPSAVASYIITANMNGDENLAASIVMMTTLFSVFSITMFIFIFKVLSIV
jgi:hypothetical protein